MCTIRIFLLMAHLEGEEIEELAKEQLCQILIEDITLDEEYWGQPLCRNWRESLMADEYYNGTAGG